MIWDWLNWIMHGPRCPKTHRKFTLLEQLEPQSRIIINTIDGEPYGIRNIRWLYGLVPFRSKLINLIGYFSCFFFSSLVLMRRGFTPTYGIGHSSCFYFVLLTHPFCIGFLSWAATFSATSVWVITHLGHSDLFVYGIIVNSFFFFDKNSSLLCVICCARLLALPVFGISR